MKGIIVGGGIAGLTAGIALQRQGIEFELYEQAPQLREVGAGIWMASNALQVLDRLGVADKVIAAGNDLDEIGVKNASSKVLSRLYLDKVRSRYGYGTVALHRADLQRVLAAEIAPERIVTGRRLRRYDNTGDTVTATWDDSSTTQADFMIGADGIKSQTRRHVKADINWRYSGQTCWRFVLDDYPLDNPKAMYEIWGKNAGLRAAFSALNERQVYVYITLATDRNGIDDPEYLQDALLVVCNTLPREVKELVAAIPDGRQVIRTDLVDFEPIKQWHDGYCALIGDAAHATTPNLGQGACQAVESAYVLVQCLAKHRGNRKAAFDEYQRIRMPKAHYVTNTSWKYGQLTNRTGMRKWLLQTAIRLTPGFVARKRFDKIYTLNF